jgi:hypothetical protein
MTEESQGAGQPGPPKGFYVDWRLTVYPQAREAAGSHFGLYHSGERRWVPAGEGANPERSAQVAASRARTAVRRYCAANRLNRLGTLTYAGEGCHDPLAMRGHVGEFFRNLRSAKRGDHFPYLWVPELHPGGHGLHVHFACGEFIGRGLIEKAWGRGFIKIKLIGDLPVSSTAVDEARIAARYLAKYTGKDFGKLREMGLHRYDCAQRFQPQKLVIEGSLGDVYSQACELMGGMPDTFTTSNEWPGWTGPDAVAMSWQS